MTSILILIVVITLTTLLGCYAIKEGRRVEDHKKFMKNLNEFDKKQWKKEKK